MKKNKIDKIYAFICDDGIFSVECRGHWYPIIFSDAENINEVINNVQEYSNHVGIEFKLIEFIRRKVVKVIKPNDK